LATTDDVPAVMRGEAATARSVGALVIDAPVEGENVVRMPADARAYASRLYGALHMLDDAGCDVIVVERVPDDAAWLAVRDRGARTRNIRKCLTNQIERELRRRVQQVAATDRDLSLGCVEQRNLVATISIPRVEPGDELQSRRWSHGAQTVPTEPSQRTVTRG